MPSDNHHSFIHHDTIDYKEQATHPRSMVYGQAEDESFVNCWVEAGLLRFQINGGIICKFPHLPGQIKRIGVEGATVYMNLLLENEESAVYKISAPPTGHDHRIVLVRNNKLIDQCGVRGLWQRQWGKALYAYRVSTEDPERDGIHIDTNEVGDAQPIAIHRFCVIFYKKSKIKDPSVHRLTPNIIIVEHNEDIAHSESEHMFPSPAFAVEHSPIVVILTISGNLLFLDVDSNTVNLVKKKYESAGIRAIFKGVNSFRRIVGVIGDSIVIECDVIAGSAAHSTQFKVFKARLPQKYREMTKRPETRKKSAWTDPDPVKLVRYVQYLAQCSECAERECRFPSQSIERINHHNTNFEKKRKGMESSYGEIRHKLNERYKVKKAELFTKTAAPSEYSVLWGELLSRRKEAQEEFDEAMSLMDAAKRQLQ